MAAEESSQGAALGPDFSEPAGGNPPAKPDIPDLNDVLGEFMVALCVVEMVSRTLYELMEEASRDIGPCAIALRHGFEMLDAVYTRFDEGLLGYDGPSGDEPSDLEDDPSDPDPGGEPAANDDKDEDSATGHNGGKQNRLALVA